MLGPSVYSPVSEGGGAVVWWATGGSGSGARRPASRRTHGTSLTLLLLLLPLYTSLMLLLLLLLCGLASCCWLLRWSKPSVCLNEPAITGVQLSPSAADQSVLLVYSIAFCSVHQGRARIVRSVYLVLIGLYS